jgi:hypothetical protein
MNKTRTLHSMVVFAAWFAASSAFAQSIPAGAPHGVCRNLRGPHADQTQQQAINADVERLNIGNPCSGDAASKDTAVDALANHDASANTKGVNPKPPPT